jgi:hypothetical protein
MNWEEADFINPGGLPRHASNFIVVIRDHNRVQSRVPRPRPHDPTAGTETWWGTTRVERLHWRFRRRERIAGYVCCTSQGRHLALGGAVAQPLFAQQEPGCS